MVYNALNWISLQGIVNNSRLGSGVSKFTSWSSLLYNFIKKNKPGLFFAILKTKEEIRCGFLKQFKLIFKMEIDEIDRKILSILMQDANMPYTKVAEQVHVSGGTVHVRMKKLTQMGIVTGANLTVDHSKLGYDITAFLGIFLDKSSLYEEVAEDLKKIPEVVGAHYTTGNYSIFAKIVCRDTNHLRDVLHDNIQM
ncbi:MAG: Lrp/AsnC family transcriptional regulator for asnA, asnC and gidA, partial [Saprospiraceae bacterium]